MLLLGVLVMVMIFPYLNVLALAFNDADDSKFGGITFFPRKFSLTNFEILLGSRDVIRATVVSVLRVVIGTAIALFVQYTCAYAFTIREMRGKATVLMFLMIPLYFSGGLIPQYLLFSKLHLLNNFLVYVLPVSFSLYNMVIIRAYLRTIPDSLAESARIDGANEFRILRSIFVPLSMPIIAVLALWSAVGLWNDWTTTLYFVTDKDLYTLQYILMKILRESEQIMKLIEEAMRKGALAGVDSSKLITPAALKSANIIVTTVPIVIVYPFLQKYFVQGITLGAVKE